MRAGGLGGGVSAVCGTCWDFLERPLGWHTRGLPNPDAFWSHASALHYPEKNKNQASMTRQAVLCAWGAYLCAPPGQNQPCCPELLCLQQPCIKQVNTVARAHPQKPGPAVATSVLGEGAAWGTQSVALPLGHHLLSAASSQPSITKASHL